MSIKEGWSILKGTFQEFGEDKVLRLSAAMAYYTVFSIGPLLVLLVGVAGLAFGQDTVREQVMGQLRGALGEQSTGMIASMMDSRRTGGSLMATIIGGVGLLFGAAGVFGQLQDSLNTIWEVKPKEGTGIWGFIRDRFLSLTMVLGLGFLLLVSMVLTTLLGAFSGYLSGVLSLPEWLLGTFHFLFTFAFITLLFAMIFKVLPDVNIQWRDVWTGAVVTALLFVAGKFALGWYLGREGATSTYGAASSFVLILLYIYYSAVILFFGAEFTQVQAKHRGVRFRTTRFSEPITEDSRANEGMPRKGKSSKGAPSREPRPGRNPSPAVQPSGAFTFAKNPHGSVEIEFMPKQTSISGPTRVTHSPIQSIRQQPWSFLTLAVATGLAAGLFMKFKTLRRGFKLYTLVRRVI